MVNLVRSLHIGSVFATQDHVGIKYNFCVKIKFLL